MTNQKKKKETLEQACQNMTLDIKKGPGQVYNPLPVRIYMSGLEPRHKKVFYLAYSYKRK